MLRFAGIFVLFLSIGLIGCHDGNSDDNFFNQNSSTPVANATLTLPSGTAADATATVAYSFTVTILGVNGIGDFAAVFGSTTGTASAAGLSISFSDLVSTGNAFEFTSVGTVSGPFTGNGTVAISITYTETGITINGNTGTFTVTVTGGTTLAFAPVSPGTTAVGVDLPITATGSPVGGTYSTSGFVDTGTGGSFTAIDAALGTFTFTGSIAAGSASIDVTYTPGGGFPPITATYTVTTTGAPPVVLSFCSGPLTDVVSDAAPVVSTITVASGTTSITDLRLLLDISHTFTGDLDITLTSPALTVIDVTSDNGGGGDDMGVIFDDAVADSITTFAGSPGNPTPFPCFTPESPLSTFDTEDANGDWILTVTDDAGGDSGTLNSWCLAFNGDTTLVPACPAGPVLAFSSGALTDVISDALPVASTITVAGSTVSIADVRVLVDISHTFTGDIDMGLTSPALTVIALSMDNGGGGDDMGVIFDDAAGASITTFAGTPGNPTPFPSFTPVSALSAFDTQDANGDWILGIVDDAAGDSGTLNSWALEFDGDTSIF